MSTSWLLVNVYTAESCKEKKRDPDALKLLLVSYGRQPLQKTSALHDSRRVGRGADNPTLEGLFSRNLKKQ
jgi:hypothetical protein